MLVHALQHTAADVTMHVVGDVYSAHATLSLMGNHHVFERNVKFLFHLAHSDRPYDQLDPNVKQILDAVNEEFIQEFGTQLKEIVTPEQYDRILNHLDVIVGGDQVLQGVTQ